MSYELPRVNVLGVGINAINMGRTLDTIEGWIHRREAHYVCVTPAHVVMECYRQPDLYPLFNSSGLTTPDGMSIVWLLKLHGRRGVRVRPDGGGLPGVRAKWLAPLLLRRRAGDGGGSEREVDGPAHRTASGWGPFASVSSPGTRRGRKDY